MTNHPSRRAAALTDTYRVGVSSIGQLRPGQTVHLWAPSDCPQDDIPRRGWVTADAVGPDAEYIVHGTVISVLEHGRVARVRRAY